MDTIDMDEQIEADLLKDAKDYDLPETETFTADCGIAYRCGYIFYGRFGSGKSLFSAALAAHLNCDLYVINLANGNVTDGGLHQLLLSLLKKCIVVIEDTNAAGIGRAMENKDDGIPPPVPDPSSQQYHDQPLPPHRRGRQTRPNMVSLSGLLTNAIEGNASQEGRFIMTSKNPDVLDEALTGPGSVYEAVHLDELSGSASNIYIGLIGRLYIASDLLSMLSAAEKAIAFAQELSPNAFTPAEVQNYHQFPPNDPDKAIAGVKG